MAAKVTSIMIKKKAASRIRLRATKGRMSLNVLICRFIRSETVYVGLSEGWQ